MQNLVVTRITSWQDFIQYEIQKILSPEFILEWIGRLVHIVIVIAVAYVMLLVINLAIKKALMPINNMTADDNNRVMTLCTLARSLARYVVIFIALLSILQELGVNTTSILAGASMIGLAVGVGSQNLIRDFLTGFFILMENQYDVGDYIVVGDMSGTVEAVNLRFTKLRADNGAVHILPNSSVVKVTNMSRGAMAATVTVPFKYEINIFAAAALLNDVCIKAKEANEYIIEGPSVVGITDMKPDGLIFTVAAKVKPTTQFNVEVYLREAIQLAFKDAGMKIG
ncbi:MAG: mechanosensitive ion channel family protein [Negativicutes bacterium]|jgi:small conductance mechanosensitive channel